MGSPSASTTGDASGSGPASATVASRGGDGGSAASSGGSSSAPASQSSASAAPKQGVDAADSDDDVDVPGTSATSASVGSASGVMPSFPRGPHILSTAEVDDLFGPGQQPLVEEKSDVPSNWVDPEPTPEGQPFLVGVPALAEDFRVGNHIANIYGGPGVLVGLEGFTAADISELERVIPDFTESQMLVPHVDSRDRLNLEAHMGSVDVHRELAAILLHLPHQRLAERVYKTSGFLKQMAGAHRRLRLQVENQGGTSLVDTAAIQNESEDLKRQWVFNCQYWRHEVLDARRTVGEVEDRLSAEAKNLASHYQDQIDALEAEKSALEERLKDSQAETQLLKARPTTTAMDSWGFLEYLFEHGELNGSWVRLRELLVNFQEGKAPPEDWDTIINVTTMDQRKAAIPDFSKRLAKVRFNQAAEAKKTARVLDLTRTGSGVAVSGDPAGDPKKSGKAHLVAKPSSPTKSAKSSGKRHIRVPQDRPKSYTPGTDSVRPANAKSPVSKDVVHTLLPDGVVWEEVRPDLRLALLAGLKYETAMKWLRTDKPAHSLFTGRPLVQMLVCMMYWRKLNQTPWTSYVPETYYTMAEEELRRLQKSDVEPPAWEALDAHVPYPISEPESTEDDPQKDPDFKASGEQESSSSDEESGDEESGNGSSASEDKESDDHSRSGSKRPRDYESSDTDDSGPIIPSKKSKRGSVHEAARSKSSSQKSGGTSKSSPKNKKSGDSKSHKSPSGKQPSGKLRKSSGVQAVHIADTEGVTDD